MPTIPYTPVMGDLFGNLQQNWGTLMPILAVLFGIIFGTFLIKKIYDHVKGE